MTNINYQENNLFISNTATNANIILSEKHITGLSTNAMLVGTTGIVNYVPYTPQGANTSPTLLTQVGGTILYTAGNTGISSTTPLHDLSFNIVNTGTYMIVGCVDISFASSVAMTSWGVFFDTSSNIVNSQTAGNPYSISREYVRGASTGITVNGNITRQTLLCVNITSVPQPIYLNYYATYATTSVQCRSNSTASVSRVA